MIQIPRKLSDEEWREIARALTSKRSPARDVRDDIQRDHDEARLDQDWWIT